MRLHERYVRTAIRMGWHVVQHPATQEHAHAQLEVTRGRERIRVWFDDRGNVNEALGETLVYGDSARVGGRFFEGWRASQRPDGNGEQVLRALEEPELRTGRYIVGEHVVTVPLDPTKPLVRRVVTAVYYDTAMAHTIATAGPDGSSDYTPLENVRRVR